MSFMDDLVQVANGVLRRAGTNVTEIGAIAANAASLPKLLAAREEALRWSYNVSYAFTSEMETEDKERTALASRNEGPADALRHCYLSAMLGRDIGYEDALLVLASHEMNDQWGTPASRMDLYNNAVGLEIGVRMKSASDADLQEATMNAFLQGRLRIVDKANGNVLVPTKSLTFGR